MRRPASALAFAFLVSAAFGFSSNETVAAKLQLGQYKLSNGQQLCVSTNREWYGEKWSFGQGHWIYQGDSLILTGIADQGTAAALITNVKPGFKTSYVYIRWTGRGDKKPTLIAGDEIKYIKEKCSFYPPRPPGVEDDLGAHDLRSRGESNNEIEPGQYFFYSDKDGRCLTKKGKWYPVRVDDRDWGGRWGDVNKSYYLYGNDKTYGGYVFSIMINKKGKLSYIDALWSDAPGYPSTYVRELTYTGSKCEPKSP